jgi:hypothetical protein
LAAEVAFGVTGLGLLLHRVTRLGCRRRSGFQAGSLSCDPRADVSDETVVRLRKAEETMAWFFLGTVALDIVLAQVRFKPFETTSVRRVKRKELEQGGALPPEPRRKRRQRNKPRAKVRPAPAMIPSGGGLGVHVRF